MVGSVGISLRFPMRDPQVRTAVDVPRNGLPSFEGSAPVPPGSARLVIPSPLLVSSVVH